MEENKTLYIITKNNKKYEIKLEKKYYENIIKNIEIINYIYKFENLYEQLISYYLEFKSEIYSSGLKFFNQPSHHYIEIYKMKSKINGLAFNILNLSKLYLDTLSYKDKSILLKITQNEEKNIRLKNLISKKYNENSGYRLAYKLRNYVQHKSLPMNDFYIGENEVVSFLFSINKKELLSSNITKKTIEDFSSSELINLDSLLYEYISSISEFHKFVSEEYKVNYDKIKKDIVKLKNIIKEEELLEIFFNEETFSINTFEIIDYLKKNHKEIKNKNYMIENIFNLN